MTPLVSAIMLTTYPKRASMMFQAITSFLAQTYRPMELVIVNNGSPLLSNHPRIRVVRSQSHASIGMKRNLGVEAARGEYVATWDDDDFSMPERIETQVKELLSSPDAVYHRCSRMWLGDPSLRVVGSFENSSYATSMLHRRTLIDADGYPDLSYLEDMEAFIRFSIRGHVRLSTNTLFYVHRRHGSNVSSDFSAQTFASHAAKSDQSDTQAIQSANQTVNTILSSHLSNAAKVAVLPG